MRKKIKKIISMVLSTACILTMTAIPIFAADSSSLPDKVSTGHSQLEEKYNVTIKEAPTVRTTSTLSPEEIDNTLVDLEAALIIRKGCCL